MAAGRRWAALVAAGRSWRALLAAALAAICLRAYGALAGVMDFRARAQADACAAPAGFLKLPGGAPSRPLRLFRINDGVMGGRSTSQLTATKEGIVFEGVIDTNGGGFASFRTLGDEAPLGLPRASAAVLVDASGDGQTYKVALHTADSWAMKPSWGNDFKAGRRQVHRLPLKGFIPTKQGRVVAAQTLSPEEITGIGFALSLYSANGKPNQNFGAGPFRLVIHKVEVVEQ